MWQHTFQTHQRELASTEPLYQQVQSVGTTLQQSADPYAAKQIKKELATLQVFIYCYLNATHISLSIKFFARWSFNWWSGIKNQNNLCIQDKWLKLVGRLEGRGEQLEGLLGRWNKQEEGIEALLVWLKEVRIYLSQDVPESHDQLLAAYKQCEVRCTSVLNLAVP